ncbi:MAG: hypothetical protein OXJ52_04000 [Oligoflexia bacterium]|nr:hypothetical protein [Oligoflexia bacterium]
MKKISFVISVFVICACDYQFSLKEQKSTDTAQDFFIPKVYFKEANQFIDIKTLNRGNRALGLSDQIVFSDEKSFLNDKDKSAFNLEPLEKFANKENIKIRVSSFCSQSKTDLKTLKKTDRLFQELASSSPHSSFSIIDLIPTDFLLAHLDNEFYCTFIFTLKNKQKDLAYYNLTQQTIQADSSDNQTRRLALIQATDFGYEYAPVNYIVRKKNIRNTLLLNNTDQAVTNYELFCDGLKIMDVPDFKINIGSVFVHLMAVEKLQKGIKNCRFFSKNNKKITGITRSFLLDFNSLRAKKDLIDLDLIEEPDFVDISKKNVYPAFFKIWDDLPNWVREKFVRPTKPYISPKNSLALNAYIHFKNLNQISQNGNYSSIEMILETECLDSHPHPESNLFGMGESVSTVVRLPLREKTPIATALPSSIFEMGGSYDQWLRELIKLQRRIDRSARYISKLDFKKRNKTFYRRYARQLKTESELREIRHQITCLYTIKLEDTNNPQNNREFKTRSYRILWTRGAYGVSYTAFPEGKNPFITLKQQANADRRRFETIRSNSTMGYLSLTFFDLIETPFLQEENYGLEQFALSCNSERDQKLYLSWPYSSAINNQIVLKDLFSHSDFQSYMKEEDKANCRVLFYKEGHLLKYFSGEIRLR